MDPNVISMVASSFELNVREPRQSVHRSQTKIKSEVRRPKVSKMEYELKILKVEYLSQQLLDRSA